MNFGSYFHCCFCLAALLVTQCCYSRSIHINQLCNRFTTVLNTLTCRARCNNRGNVCYTLLWFFSCEVVALLYQLSWFVLSNTVLIMLISYSKVNKQGATLILFAILIELFWPISRKSRISFHPLINFPQIIYQFS